MNELRTTHTHCVCVNHLGLNFLCGCYTDNFVNTMEAEIILKKLHFTRK